MARPKESKIDASFLRQEVLKSLSEITANLRRYSKEQIAKSATLSKRVVRVKHLEEVLRRIDRAIAGEEKHLKRKQPTRMLLAGCIGCQYQVRLTRKWADVCMPLCGNKQCDDYNEPFQFIEARPYAFAYSQAQKEFEAEMAAANAEPTDDLDPFGSAAGDLNNVFKEE